MRSYFIGKKLLKLEHVLEYHPDTITLKKVEKITDILLHPQVHKPSMYTIDRLIHKLSKHPLVTAEIFKELFIKITLASPWFYSGILNEMSPHCKNVVFQLFSENNEKAEHVINLVFKRIKHPQNVDGSSDTSKFEECITDFFSWYDINHTNDLGIELKELPQDMALDLIGWKWDEKTTLR
jgi:hypothetical protein